MSIDYLPPLCFTFMNWGLIRYIAPNEHISEELSRMLTTVDVIWYFKICRHCVSSIHRIVGYTLKIFVDRRSLRECILFHHRLATITWLTITECHSWTWTFSVVKIMSSFLCLCQARSVQSHIYVLRGYLFYLLLRGWFWILWLFWQCGIFCFSFYSWIVIYHRVCLLTSILTYVTRRMSLVEQKLLSLVLSHSMIYVDNITRCN